jgi:hypothetical protein
MSIMAYKSERLKFDLAGKGYPYSNHKKGLSVSLLALLNKLVKTWKLMPAWDKVKKQPGSCFFTIKH